jgi:hypothetical protein
MQTKLAANCHLLVATMLYCFLCGSNGTVLVGLLPDLENITTIFHAQVVEMWALFLVCFFLNLFFLFNFNIVALQPV